MAATPRALDMSKVKEGGAFRPKHKPEGDYRAKIVKADDHTPKDKTKEAGWVLTIQVEGDARSSYPYYLSPAENQLWKIRGIMVAAGFPAKAARIKFDPNKLVGKSIGVALEDDEYEGRPKSTIGDVFPASEVGGNADEDAPEDDVDDIDTDEDEVTIPDEDDEVEAYDPDAPDEDDEPEPEPAPVRRRKAKPAPEPEPEDDDQDDDEDEDEPEPTPPPRKRRTTTTRGTRTVTKPVADDDEDLDLDDLDD